MRVELATGLLAVLSVAVAGGAPAALVNPGFEDGLTGWRLAPGDDTMATVEAVNGVEGHVLHLQAQGKTLGVDSAPLVLGADLDPAKTYQVSARLKFGGLTSGIAAFSVCAVDATGRRLVQYSVQNWQTESKPHDWVTRSALIGPGTGKPFPEGAHAVHLRVSFHEPAGQCAGEIWVDEVAVSACAPPKFADWPASILVRSGDVEVRFESRSFWTLYRIDYQGTRICKDLFGSHYGSVANVKGVGFIGSGHTENGETEQLKDLALQVDGVLQPRPTDAYTANAVTLRKQSRVRDLVLDTTVTVQDNRISEAVAMRAEKPLDLNLMYHFMHPWVLEMSHFLAEKRDGTTLEGRFVDDKGMKVCAPVNWSAVFSESLGKGAVTLVEQVPEDMAWEVRYWDMPGSYRKHYFTVFSNATVEPGRTFEYRVLTVPFSAAAGVWQATAKDVVAKAAAKR